MSVEMSDCILRTVAYFDLFSHPLTARELRQFLWSPPAIAHAELLAHLRSLVDGGELGFTSGHYHLPGREQTVAARRQAFLEQEKKLAIARRLVRKLRYIPGVRLAAVCNTVGAGWPTRESDVDLFIVAHSGRLWLTRLLVTLVTALMNLRRADRAVANKVCLSFFVTDNHLDISSVALAASSEVIGSERQGDVYLTYWLHQLIPIYDPENLHAKMLAANQWTRANLPGTLPEAQVLTRYRAPETRLSSALRGFFERLTNGSLGGALERAARRLQLYKMGDSARLHSELAPGAGVVISDTMLKFHEADRREEYRRQWLARRQEVIGQRTRMSLIPSLSGGGNRESLEFKINNVLK